MHAHARNRARTRMILLLFVVVVVVRSVKMLNTMNFYPWNDIFWIILMLILLWITC